MIELCHIAADSIADLEVLNDTTIQSALAELTDPQKSRIVITNESCYGIYDTNASNSLSGKYILLPEIITALDGNNVFQWSYDAGVIHSFAAVPIVSYGELIGCVYMTEHDAEQGALISALQRNIFVITFVLELTIIAFSVIFSRVHANRIRKVMRSIRTVRNGDYSHKLDLTGHDELNLLSNEFNDLINRLQTSESKRNRFVSDASHELKTPLASIKLLSDSILHNDMDPDTVKEFVGDIGNEADRLNRMSQKLLTLSRIDNQVDNRTEITQIVPTIERVIRMLSPYAEESNITLNCTLEQDATILIPEDDLYQVIFNLVENGIKYNVKNGQLTISLVNTASNAVICIQDTGVGIPAESLDHVFERFYRVDKARSRSTGGSGLGLSIVRNIVRRNGGMIDINSTVGLGTTFTVSFPVFHTKEDTP